MIEYVLWATPLKGSLYYVEENEVKFGEQFEQFITSTKDTVRLEQAKAWAIKNGFGKLRVMVYGGEAPDFIGTINV